MSVKVFNLARFLKTAGGKNTGLGYVPEPATPYDWSNVPDTSHGARKQYVEQQIADILSTSPSPMADSYGALQKVPFQGGYGSPDHMMKIHGIHRQLESYVSSLSPEEQKAFLDVWGGDLRNAIAFGLEQSGYKYNPALFDAFSQRMTPGKLDSLFQQPSEDIKAVAQSHRQSWLRTLQREVMGLYEELEAQYGITQAEFTHLCYLGEISPSKPPLNLQFAGEGPRGYLVDKLGGISEVARITKMLKWITYEHPRQLQASEDNTKRINHLFSGYNEQPGDRDIYPTPEPITREDILNPLGFTMAVYPPSRPSWEIQKSKIPYEKVNNKDLTDEQKEERSAAWQQQRLNPNNLEVLKKYILEGGFEYGGLGALLNKSQKDITLGEDMDSDVVIGERRYPARVVKYIFDQLCQSNRLNLVEMLEANGMGYLTDDLDQSSYPDPVFSQFNLVFRSQAEQDVVNKLRKFGLMAVPMPISIPSPSDCTVNPRSFDIDFTIPCDVLRTWEMKFGQAHPVVQQTVIFVGEYFGFDRKQMINIPDGQEWKNPDGSIAKFKNADGSVVDAVGGNSVERGFKYKVSSEWKKMCETYVSHMMGNATIFIEKDSRDRDIMAQLDNNNIIYNATECSDASCCVATHQMRQHLEMGCNDPACAAKRYIGDKGNYQAKPYSKAEAYIISCIEDLKVKYGFAPTAKQNKDMYSSAEMFKYFTEYNKKLGTLNVLWKQYEASIKGGNQEGAEAYLMQYNTIKDSVVTLQKRYMSALQESYQQQLENPMYKVRADGLNALLSAYKQSNGQMPDSIVARVCAEYMGANPPAQLPTHVSGYNNSTGENA